MIRKCKKKFLDQEDRVNSPAPSDSGSDLLWLEAA